MNYPDRIPGRATREVVEMGIRNYDSFHRLVGLRSRKRRVISIYTLLSLRTRLLDICTP
jgi:hypothetical protein